MYNGTQLQCFGEKEAEPEKEAELQAAWLKTKQKANVSANTAVRSIAK